MSTTAKASDHVKPCNIEQSERHNRRDAEYIASLNPRILYVRTDLSPNNESYVVPDMKGVSLQQHYNAIKAMVKQKTGRAMQEKKVMVTGKNGKQKERNGSSPIRESVVNIKPDTTMNDLLKYTEKVHERWGIRAIQIHIHKDEGHYENPDDPSTWKPNLHAHIIWDWMNHETGKSYKLGKKDMEELQDMAAETLDMERGKKKAETGLEHLERNDLILKQQKTKMRQLQDKAELAIAMEKEAIEGVSSAIEDRNLAIAEEQVAKENLQELRNAAADEKKKLEDEYEKKRRKLDGILYEKRQERNQLNETNKSKIELSNHLDDEILEKQNQSSMLDSTIKSQNEKIEELSTEIERTINQKYALKVRDDWQDPMFHGMATYIYATNELLRFCVDAIVDFAKSGFGGRGGQHGDILWDNESTAIKHFLTDFANLVQTSINNVAQWLVWIAKQVGRLNDWELRRADDEVKDVVDGRYDGRIRRFENHHSGLSM